MSHGKVLFKMRQVRSGRLSRSVDSFGSKSHLVSPAPSRPFGEPKVHAAIAACVVAFAFCAFGYRARRVASTASRSFTHASAGVPIGIQPSARRAGREHMPRPLEGGFFGGPYSCYDLARAPSADKQEQPGLSKVVKP
jgi:hypothetical protein